MIIPFSICCYVGENELVLALYYAYNLFATDVSECGEVKQMDFIDLARQRYSERYFDPEREVEQEKLDLILEAGRLAPTGCNNQPQRIYVIKSPEAMAKAVSTKASLCHCPIALLICYNKDEVWKNKSDRCYEEYNCGEQDVSSVGLSMIFEAEELGVHTLWIRGFDSQDVIDAFELPANEVPVMMIALGYPSSSSHPAHLHSKRKSIDETVKYI